MNDQFFKTNFQIISTGHWITDQISKALKEFGATEPQFNVLRILKGAKGNPVSVQEIQKKMVQRSSNVTRIVDKLLDRGYVDRQQCPSNRRKMDVTITAEGLDYLKILDKKIIEIYEPRFNKLTEEELKTLENLIIKFKS